MADRVVHSVRFFFRGANGVFFRGEMKMLGFGDVYIVSAVLGCIAASAFGIVYGALRWNSGGEKK